MRLGIVVVLVFAACGVALSGEAADVSEQEASALVLKALGTKCHAPVECQFKLEHGTNGWTGIVWFYECYGAGRCGYRVGGGGHVFALVRDDGTVEIRPGA